MSYSPAGLGRNTSYAVSHEPNEKRLFAINMTFLYMCILQTLLHGEFRLQNL